MKLFLKTFLIIVFIFCISVYSFSEEIADESQLVYEKYKSSVFQIQTINLATGKKTAIGSGFQFESHGFVATNYHVVSPAINFPNRYRVEYICSDGTIGLLKILDVDVVHDLAILYKSEDHRLSLSLGVSEMAKGAKIFSFGNPHDLGLTIMDGIYNGLMQKAMYRKILFSGSLNPGMSGGPALDHSGRVIGINVATAGNQISFLVPVEYLRDLYEKVILHKLEPIGNWHDHIEKQLLVNQKSLFDEILSSSSEWDVLKIGEMSVPGELSDKFKCWGESTDNDRSWFKYAYSHCSSEDQLFLSSSLTTGQIIYKYSWVESRGLNPLRFYNHYEENYSQPHSYVNAGVDDVHNFKCQSDFIDINQRDFKATICSRQYKNYPQLYDMNLSLASVDREDRGLLVEVVALGVNKVKSIEFLKKFIKAIKWLE